MICIDPGLRGIGMAIFSENELHRAEYVKNPHNGRGYAAHSALAHQIHIYQAYRNLFSEALIELPQVYPGMPKTDLNDLIDVAGVGAACAYVLAEYYGFVKSVFPREWKGSVDKQVMLKRIWSKLTPGEQAVVQKTNKSDTEDILDAIGIGLWRLNRLNTKNYPGATP